MKNLFKSKKINSFLLTMIMIISLFFFNACDESDMGGDNIILKVFYRPYASSRVSLFGDTYAETIEKDLLEVSGDVLSRIVGEYGIGEVSVKDGESTKIVSPDAGETNYQALLAVSSLTEAQNKAIAGDFSSITNIYFSFSSSIMILSNFSVNSTIASNMVTYDDVNTQYVANTSLTKISGSGGAVSSSDALETNCVYKYSNGNSISYIFLGGYIGSNSNENSFTSALNINKYLAKLFGSNYNKIQHSFVGSITASQEGIDVSDGLFAAWTYSLTSAEYNSCNGDANAFKEKYLEKYQFSFAVELAKTILTRYEGLTLTEELTTLYTSASSVSASNSDKETFIEKCCEYIDHYGLLPEENELLKNYILNTLIGSTITSSNPNYAENCASVLEESRTNYTANPILEYRTYEGLKEEPKVDGYIQSFVIMTTDEYDFSNFAAVFESEDESVKSQFLTTIRHYSDGVVNEYPYVIGEEDMEDNFYSFSISDASADAVDKLKIVSCTDNIPSGALVAKNTIDNDIKHLFKYSKTTQNTVGCAWCFEDASASYVEVVFGTNTMFDLFELKVSSIMI